MQNVLSVVQSKANEHNYLKVSMNAFEVQRLRLPFDRREVRWEGKNMCNPAHTKKNIFFTISGCQQG